MNKLVFLVIFSIPFCVNAYTKKRIIIYNDSPAVINLYFTAANCKGLDLPRAGRVCEKLTIEPFDAKQHIYHGSRINHQLLFHVIDAHTGYQLHGHKDGIYSRVVSLPFKPLNWLRCTLKNTPLKTGFPSYDINCRNFNVRGYYSEQYNDFSSED